VAVAAFAADRRSQPYEAFLEEGYPSKNKPTFALPGGHPPPRARRDAPDETMLAIGFALLAQKGGLTIH